MRASFLRNWITVFSVGCITAMGADGQVEQKAAEDDLLKDVKAPAGFEATVFAAPPMANYPVFIAAGTEGTLFVSSDGNGSLGKDLHRGRVLRLRDLDGDGRADEVKEFVKDVDSPRGLVWDHDRLYLLHPPHISEYIDRDGDGVAEDSRILVKNIAFTFKDRPADHSSNGMEMGVDGWLYCAIGDFGFMEAEGTDGRKVQLRGGGVVRVRPDGTGLHIYARGTRNILEAAVSPLLDVITRDNTNDGGGWDVRLHHNTGLANHGYPSLYKNFNDEIIQPLADYGGGSGCGAAWIDEPGIPAEWNNAPFTADWGRGWVYRHGLTPKGATYNANQKQFIGMTRPTDLDVDGNSRVYVASWKGAQFNWAGPNVGYIVQLRPTGFAPAPMPNFEKLEAKELIALLDDRSHRRRLEAQRALLRRGLAAQKDLEAAAIGANTVPPVAPLQLLEGRVAATFALAQLQKEAEVKGANESLLKISGDARLREFAIRAMGELDRTGSDDVEKEIIRAVKDRNDHVRLQAIIASGFRGLTNAGANIAEVLEDRDPVVAHTAIQAMQRMKIPDPLWAMIAPRETNETRRAMALRVLQGIHVYEVAEGLRQRLDREQDPARRAAFFKALCRLHSTDGPWKGDSWGTRPDTSGPYYQAAAWSETAKILGALNLAVSRATPEELAGFAAELTRHKIQSEEALEKVIDAAATDEKLAAVALGMLVRAEKIPANAEPILLKAAAGNDTAAGPRGQAIVALAKLKSPEAVKAGLTGLGVLAKSTDEAGLRQARNQFFNSPALDGQIELLEKEAVAGNVVADTAILSLSERRGASAETRAAAKAAYQKGWETRKVQVLKAMAMMERPVFREQVLAAMEDSDPAVAAAAKETARVLRLERRRNAPSAPKIETMSVPDAVAAAVKAKGDLETGKKLFTQLTCVNCHTVSEKEAQRGPYLGNIAATYKRPELAEAILNPNKSIAQGFVANRFIMKNGDDLEGFVTLEAADQVTIRDIAAKESTLKVADIDKRLKLEKSLMPEGLAAQITVQELASLLDYLESMAAK